MTLNVTAVHHGGGLGGAPVSMLKLLAALDRADFTAGAIFTESGPIIQYAHSAGVPASVVPTGGALFYSAHARLGVRSVAHFLSTFPSSVLRAQSYLRRSRPDVLQLNTSVLLAWAAAARRVRGPVVWLVREVLGANAWLRGWHAAFILRHARQVVAVSDAVRACFPSEARVARVHNAVDLGEFRLELRRQIDALRGEIGVPGDARVVMAIGAVQKPKGHWLLLEAFQRLPANAHLVLVTGGVSRQYAVSARGRIKRALRLPLDNLDALLRDARALGLPMERIHVTGFRADISRVLAAADVLAFASLEPEGFGRPIIEAMALGCPVVATNVGPSAELLGTEAGVLVEPDADRLAEALQRLFESPDERARIGRAGRARVEACFTLERQVGEMAAIYHRAADGSA